MTKELSRYPRALSENVNSELIKNRKWHQYSSRSYFSAKNDKAKFIHGENISEEYIREYLSAAGYTIKQYELWEKYKF